MGPKQVTSEQRFGNVMHEDGSQEAQSRLLPMPDQEFGSRQRQASLGDDLVLPKMDPEGFRPEPGRPQGSPRRPSETIDYLFLNELSLKAI